MKDSKIQIFKFSNLLIFCLFFRVSSVTAQPLLYLPLDHWAYPFLDRFSGLDLIHLDLEVRPVLRGEIVRALGPLLERIEKGEVERSTIDQWVLDKLVVEFQRELNIHPEKTADRPLLEWTDQDRYFTLDTRMAGILLIQKSSTPFRVSLLDLSSYGALGEKFAYDEEITVSLRKGDEIQDFGFSNAGVRSWREVRASVERAYFVMDLSRFHLEFGRNRKWWGPGRFGTLLLSTNAPPVDLIHISTRIWRFHASALTALLSPDEGRFLSNHRLALSLGKRTILGVTEAVLYNRRLPELGYLNPIIPYYLTQRNADKDDNIFWHVDLSTYPRDGVKVYGEFLIDDFQYSERDSFPDKLGGIMGFQWFDPIGIQDTDLMGEIGRIQRWVYTHRKPINAYRHEDALLGDGLGPDAERILLLLTHRWTNRVSTSIEGVSIRRGEGRDMIPWEVNRPDPRPPFPSGIAEKRRSIGMGIDYEPVWRFRITGIGRRVVWTNKDNISGSNPDDFQLEAGVEINF